MSETTRITVKVVPGSSRSAIAGWLGETLKIRVVAPPEKGKANTAVRKILADALDLPVSAVTIDRGATSPQKTIAIVGLGEPEIRQRLDRVRR